MAGRHHPHPNPLPQAGEGAGEKDGSFSRLREKAGDEGVAKPPVRRRPSPMIAGKGRTLGDIVGPIVDPADWVSP